MVVVGWLSRRPPNEVADACPVPLEHVDGGWIEMLKICVLFDTEIRTPCLLLDCAYHAMLDMCREIHAPGPLGSVSHDRCATGKDEHIGVIVGYGAEILSSLGVERYVLRHFGHDVRMRDSFGTVPAVQI